MVLSDALLNQLETEAVQTLQNISVEGAVSTDGTPAGPSDTTVPGIIVQDVVDDEQTTPNTYTATFIVQSSEGNGDTIRQAALLDTNGELVQSDTVTETSKTNDIELFIDFTTEVETTQN